MKKKVEYINGEIVDLKLDEYVSFPFGKQWRPYYIFLILVNKKEVGRVVFRLGSDEDHEFSGHIGYTVDEKYRGHHYAYEACKELIPFMKMHGYHHVLITCDPNNIASKKTIEKLNAVYLGTKPIPKSLKRQFGRDEVEKRIYRLDLEG